MAMASPKLFFSPVSISFIFITLSCLYFLSSADVSQTKPTSVSNICNSTPYPSFCRSMLLHNNSTGNVHAYGRFSLRRSMSSARKFLSLINRYLRHSKKLSISAIRALEDCKSLAELNMDLLKSSYKTVNVTSKMLPTLDVEDVQSMLSAILTNMQTCSDGLEETSSPMSVRNGLKTPLAHNKKLFSVSLALFTEGWVPKNKKLQPHLAKQQLAFRNGALPLRMTEKNGVVYEPMSRRNTLPLPSDEDRVLVNDIVIVNKDGTADFTTINEAVAAAPDNADGSNGYFLIYVTAGVFKEYVLINRHKRYLLMIGEGINKTIITGNHNAVDGWTTYQSATFAVLGDGFVAVNITFRNTAGPHKGQAVAMRNNAELSSFYSCSFEGYQDTLYTHTHRQFYRECDIYGTVDFVFGNAAAVFQNCNFYARQPLHSQNVITAQGRESPTDTTGIFILNSTIRAADDLATSNVRNRIQTYLGRPWKEYSRTIYMNTFMDSLINPLGWSPWKGDFALNTLYYAEYNNTGPGSNRTHRVTWPGIQIINHTNAATFTMENFLLGDYWSPQTEILYPKALLYYQIIKGASLHNETIRI